MALFIVTAVITAWLAYEQPTAVYKFWLLVAAVLLFYAFANQPRNNIWILASLLCLVCIGIAVYYLLTNDWGTYPFRIEFFNRDRLGWMSPGSRVRASNSTKISMPGSSR